MEENVYYNLQGSSAGFFNNAHHFTLNNPIMIDMSRSDDNQLVRLLADNVIPGAEFDSSERDPPPRCHPGTRFDISKQLHTWLRDPDRENKIVWLHGAAGVGKSAIVQTFAELESDHPDSILGATLFFSRPNERDDPQKVFITIAYQLTVKYPIYRKYVVDLLAANPKLVKKSLAEQFKWFIVKPFIEKKLFDGLRVTLVILDGLDECMGEAAQREIVLLIGRFALQYPKAPLIWIIASRPEPHIKAAFSSSSIRSSYLAIEVPHNSDQACRDVEHYLRSEFQQVMEKYPLLFPASTKYWPSENDFLLIAARARGLFVFASTIVRFIDNMAYGNPVSQLQKVIDILDYAPHSSQTNPLEMLDILYKETLSSIPPDVLPTAMKLLTFLHPRTPLPYLANLANWLGLSQADVYGALHKLHPILKIPLPAEAQQKPLTSFHTSFNDFLTSPPSRSGNFYVDEREAKRSIFWLSHRILLECLSGNRTDIQTSRIHLSWPFEDTQRCQQALSQLSFSFILIMTSDVLDQSIWNGFSDLAPFFRVFNFRTAFWSDEVSSSLVSLCGSPFRPHFEDWKLLKAVQVQSLDWNQIDFDEKARISWYKSNDHEEEHFKALLDWDWDSKMETYLDNCEVMEDGLHTHCVKVLPLAASSEWKTRVEKHIAELVETAPTIRVELAGKCDDGLAFIQVELKEKPYEMWEYLFHYKW